MTQYIAIDIDTGDVLQALGRPDLPELVGPPAPPPDDGCTYIAWQGALSFDPPSPTSVLRAVDGAPVWVETAPLDELKSKKNAEINQWRALANQSTFEHGGKVIACDALSRSDIDAVANHIGLFGEFPQGFPMAWKATDNSYLPMPDVAAFKAMYAAMTAQGTANFGRAQELKVDLGNADNAVAVATITWALSNK